MNRLIREIYGTPESHPLTFNEFATNAEVFGLVEKVQPLRKEGDSSPNMRNSRLG